MSHHDMALTSNLRCSALAMAPASSRPVTAWPGKPKSSYGPSVSRACASRTKAATMSRQIGPFMDHVKRPRIGDAVARKIAGHDEIEPGAASGAEIVTGAQDQRAYPTLRGL